MHREQSESSTPLDQLQNVAMNLVETFCSVSCMPVEIILRPKYGTRYYPVYVTFLSAALMILIPAFGTVATTAVSMIPFTHVAAPTGAFDMWSLSKLFYLLIFVHGFRIWRRMVFMELEQFSRFEGPPLPFYRLLPGGSAFNFVRIVLEPVTIVITASVLQHLDIITSGLAAYLYLAAVTLSMKCFCLWYRAWEVARNLTDIHNAGPLLGRIAEGKDTQEDRDQIHLASLPKREEDRKELVKHLNDVWNR
jgi:hypothetical protein